MPCWNCYSRCLTQATSSILHGHRGTSFLYKNGPKTTVATWSKTESPGPTQTVRDGLWFSIFFCFMCLFLGPQKNTVLGGQRPSTKQLCDISTYNIFQYINICIIKKILQRCIHKFQKISVNWSSPIHNSELSNVTGHDSWNSDGQLRWTPWFFHDIRNV